MPRNWSDIPRCDEHRYTFLTWDGHCPTCLREAEFTTLMADRGRNQYYKLMDKVQKAAERKAQRAVIKQKMESESDIMRQRFPRGRKLIGKRHTYIIISQEPSSIETHSQPVWRVRVRNTATKHTRWLKCKYITAQINRGAWTVEDG